MKRRSNLGLLVWAGLLAGSVGCSSDDSTSGGSGSPNGGSDLRTDKSALQRAEDCDDLLAKIQNDAIAKLDLSVELYKNNLDDYRKGYGRGDGVIADPGFPIDDVASPPPARPESPNAGASDGGGAVGGDGDFNGGGESSGGNGAGSGAGGSDSDGGPTGSSNTNTQVVGIDEADFVKVVKKGAAMFVLHGNQLYKLKSWPAEATALEGKGLKIEGSPSEMFVTDAGKAVVFSSVWGYGRNGKAYDYCGPDWCGGSGFTKITIADVSGAEPKTERELYYEGSYVSSRRYDDLVRVVMQAESTYGQLFYPDIAWYDDFGNPYSDEDIIEQLTQWRDRKVRDIRRTTLDDWMPVVQEAKGGKLSDVAPDCDSFWVPPAGTTGYGLTHVLAVDISKPNAKVDGVTIMGAASTVYSNAKHMVLAQPDYRAFNTDFGMIDRQQTALHLFELTTDDTAYKASGFVPGHLAGNIPQFALDEKDGVVRVVTTGWEREDPDAQEFTDAWWRTRPVNRLLTVQADGRELKVLDELSPLGKPNETIRSSRFVGNRGYIVTAIQQDPLYVVDLSKPDALKLLGEVEIPGFSEYMHPLDDDHLLTVGQNASLWGLQLQIFDVSDPTKPTKTFEHDFGDGTSSEASWQHKAFTFYADKGLLALPVYGYTPEYHFRSQLAVLKVDAKKGFEDLGRIDHSDLIETQVCRVYHDWGGFYDEPCYVYAPEVRRGHFVNDDNDTFVYSFSYGGVRVHNLADLATPLATVELPAPEWDSSSWYGLEGGGGSDGVGGVGGGSEPGRPTPVEPVDPIGPGVDAGVGVAEPEPVEADGGAAIADDEG